MKISKEQVAENRERILEAAARLFRERGFEKVSVAEVMAAAGLTHGGFYGHFASKDHLVAQSCHHALEQSAAKATKKSLRAYGETYLSTAHRDDPGTGCVFAALGSEATRAPEQTRHALTQSLQRQLDYFGKVAPGKTAAARRRAAIAGWSSMVGALMLSRLVDDPELSDELLRETRLALGAD